MTRIDKGRAGAWGSDSPSRGGGGHGSSSFDCRLARDEEEAVHAARNQKAKNRVKAAEVAEAAEAARPKPSMPKFSWEK